MTDLLSTHDKQMVRALAEALSEELAEVQVWSAAYAAALSQSDGCVGDAAVRAKNAANEAVNQFRKQI